MVPSEPLDTLRLRHWSVPVAIGAYDEEQHGTQPLVLDLTLRGDFRLAASTDALEHALDYAVLRTELETWLAGRRWQLLEAFGEDFCAEALRRPLVREVELIVEKPAAQAPVLVSYTLQRKK